MPIDTTAPKPGTPAAEIAGEQYDGWRAAQLAALLREQRKQAEANHCRWRGEPPLPDGAPDAAKQKFAEFQRKAGTNYERLIVSALGSRLRLRTFRVADVEAGSDADKKASAAWTGLHGARVFGEAIQMALNMGSSALVLGRDHDDDELVLSAEDPRQMLVVTKPAQPTKVVEAIKLVHDASLDQDELFLYRTDGTTARVHVAVRPRKARARKDLFGNPLPVDVTFSATGFEWDEDRSGAINEMAGRLPIMPLVNDGGVAEFEPHLTLLDRINHRTYQQLVIGAYQAFRQRVMMGEFVDPQTKQAPVDPETGQPVDFNALYQSSPDGLWLAPKDATIWESATVDMQGILAATKDDVRALSSVSSTPFYSFMPDATGGSAEGASLQREQITFKVVDRQDLWGPVPAGVVEMFFAYQGDADRSRRGSVQTVWSPAERYSLAERGAAASAAKTSGVPWRDIMTEIWQFDDDQVDRMESHRDDDLLFAAQLARQEAAAQAAVDSGAA